MWTVRTHRVGQDERIGLVDYLGGEVVLAQLREIRQFLMLDPEHEWFHYHHLFRDLLLRQLRGFGADSIPDLRRRASTWLATRGLMLEASPQAT